LQSISSAEDHIYVLRDLYSSYIRGLKKVLIAWGEGINLEEDAAIQSLPP